MSPENLSIGEESMGTLECYGLCFNDLTFFPLAYVTCFGELSYFTSMVCYIDF